jgi:tetratricopeptide (TPR) repeat protein
VLAICCPSRLGNEAFTAALRESRDKGLLEPARRTNPFSVSEFGQGLAASDLLPWLDSWIENAREQLGRRSNQDAAFEAARLEAERRFKAGRISEASSALMEEFQRETQSEKLRQEERRRARASLVTEAIRFDELALDSSAAVEKLRLLATLQGAVKDDDVARFLLDRAGEFSERGRVSGQNGALLLAVAVYRAALEERTRERVPLDWAATQNNLGNALQALGERETGTGRLEQAVAAYRAALEEYTRERVPLHWAMTERNLSRALTLLASRQT